ncbi:Uma2 family endonuclease [Pleurocapsa sp. PCC 7319]|uniref:Uma2 family endonuclease n=1 Tax=Pleurocapsa sp. PCC 7319 TaxID=118161 RepID=UPI00034970A9|nr:Uma2 family endonuclease [Pleurocapsa sp. PCC 7319]
MTSVTLSLKPFIDRISETDLEQLCQENPEARLETNSEGQLIIMSPTGSESGKFNISLAAQVWNWNNQTKLGIVFDSSTGFKLSNGAVRSPDVSWVAVAKWNSLSKQQQRKFAPIAPDFALELMSPTDELSELQKKMKEYMDCGVRLGWLINPDEKQVEIYRQQEELEILNNPQTLSGELILPNLIINLQDIFED